MTNITHTNDSQLTILLETIFERPGVARAQKTTIANYILDRYASGAPPTANELIETMKRQTPDLLARVMSAPGVRHLQPAPFDTSPK